MSRHAYKQITQFGDISQDVYVEYNNRRYEEYKKDLEQKKEYFLKCFNIYKTFNNPHEGFEAVKKQMGYKFNRRTLMENMKKFVYCDDYKRIINE